MTTELHHLAAAYALDALSPEEHQAFEAHYPTCEICSAEVADFRATAAELAAGTAREVPAGLKDRVMAEVSTTRQVSSIVPDRAVDLAERRNRNAPRSIVLAAAAAAIVVLGAIGAIRATRTSDFDQVAAAPDATTIQLAGATGTIEVIWSKERDQVALVGDGLADPGPGLVYQLWFLLGDDAGVAPAPTFSPEDGSIETVLDVEDIDGIGWGVTLEPEGGSDEPTGDVLYAGTA